MPEPERSAVTVEDCARCGGAHADMPLRRMARPFAPPEAGGLAWTHWATCPTTGDPVLVIVNPQAQPA